MSTTSASFLVRLGFRLATGSATSERFRPVVVLGTGALAAMCLLHAFATSSAAEALNVVTSTPTVSWLRWLVQLALGLPILGLVAAVTRLSATGRDRRLIRLRVLGLSPIGVRIVAAVEALSLLTIGIAGGVVVYLITQPLLGRIWQRAAEFPPEAYRPGHVGWLVSTAGLLLIASVVAIAPNTNPATNSRRIRTLARLGIAARLAILGLGIVGIASTLIDPPDQPTTFRIIIFAIAAICVILGVVLTVPIGTAVVASVMIKFARHPSTRIAARRLQSQPARAARIVTATVTTLFVLTLTYPLASNATDDPIYLADKAAATTGPQLLQIGLDRGADLDTARRILAAEGVTRIEFETQLVGPGCSAGSEQCVTALVGTCWALLAHAHAAGCDEDRPAWIDAPRPAAFPLPLAASDGTGQWYLDNAPQAIVTMTPKDDNLMSGHPSLFIPIGTPGISEWLEDQPVTLIVEGPGGIATERSLTSALRVELPGSYALATRAFSNYIQTRAQILVLNALTIAVVAVGLLSFMIASIDQVLGRRASMTNLLVLGIGSRTLRTAQLWESLIPLAIGLPAATWLGFGTGSALMRLYNPTYALNWPQLITMSSGSIVAVALVALALLVAAVPKIDPTSIRRA